MLWCVARLEVAAGMLGHPADYAGRYSRSHRVRGTSSTTTLPAPTTALSPIVTPFSTIERAPMKTLSPISTGAVRTPSWRHRRPLGSTGVELCVSDENVGAK